MENTQEKSILAVLLLYPLWGVLLPLSLIESNVIYVDPQGKAIQKYSMQDKYSYDLPYIVTIIDDQTREVQSF